MKYIADDQSLSPEAFLTLANQVWPGEYDLEKTRIALEKTQNITAYQGVDLTEECRMPLSEWLDRWLEQITSVLQSSTPEHYRSDMEHHVKLYLG